MQIPNPLLLANDEDGDGAAGGDDVTTVVDIVDAFDLKEIELKKGAWGALVKGKSTQYLNECSIPP